MKAGAPANSLTMNPAGAGVVSTPERLAALAEPIRLRLLRLLESHELTVGELAKVLQSPQSTVSRHLKILAQAGWLTRRTAGAATLYQLVLEDLPDEARHIWLAVRAHAITPVQQEDDRCRLEAVLAERRHDSRSFFGQIAGEWDEVRDELFGRGFTTHALLGLLDPDWVIADLGCGAGNASEKLAPIARRIIAVDQSEPMLDAARKRLRAFRNIDFRLGELEALPIDDESVDAGVFFLVLHHVDEPVRALREIRRALKPGGLVLMLDMTSHDRTEYRRLMGHKHLGFGASELKSLVVSSGLEMVRLMPLPRHPDAKGPGLFLAVAKKMNAGRHPGGDESEQLRNKKRPRAEAQNSVHGASPDPKPKISPSTRHRKSASARRSGGIQNHFTSTLLKRELSTHIPIE